MNLQNWLLAFRPKTLTAAVVPAAVATALVHHDGYAIHWWVSGCALTSALLIQIATNLINDALDFRKGADTSDRIGPRRATQSGLLKEGLVMAGGVGCLLLAAIFGVPLLVQGGLPILLIGLVSLFLGYAYTGGPYPLAYKGLGEIFVVLFFGVIAVGGVYLLQTGQWPPQATIAGPQVGLLATVLLAINNLRDREGDAKVHKHTLAVRLGVRFSRFEIGFCALMPFVLNPFWDSPWAQWLPLLSLPIAIILIKGILAQAPGPVYNRYLGLGALMHLSFGLFLCVGLW